MPDLSFYKNPTLSDGFGSKLPPRTNSHRGLDFPHGAGTPIPAYTAGTVVISTTTDDLGNIVEVRGDNGRFIGYRHMQSGARAGVGQRLEVGQTVGYVGNTGRQAYGYHLCTTNASAQGGVYGGLSIVADPWPYIQQALAGQGSTAPASAPSGVGWAYWEPSGDLAKRVQQALKNRGRYGGPVDGVFGENTRRGVQLTLKNAGLYGGAIDGIIQAIGSKGIQQYAAKYGDYSGPIDSKPGVNSWTGFALGLERP